MGMAADPVVWSGSPRRVPLGGVHDVLGLVACVVIGAIAFTSGDKLPRPVLWVFLTALVIAGIGSPIVRWIRRRSSRYVLTSTRLTVQTTAFGRSHTDSVDLAELAPPRVTDHRDGTGTITFGASSLFAPTRIVLHHVDNAWHVAAVISNGTTMAAQFATPPSLDPKEARRLKAFFSVFAGIAAAVLAGFAYAAIDHADDPRAMATVVSELPSRGRCDRFVVELPDGRSEARLCDEVEVGEQVEIRFADPDGTVEQADDMEWLGFAVGGVLLTVGVAGLWVTFRRPDLLAKWEVRRYGLSWRLERR